jgi:signal transduction histidine kinase/tetratricopeptide (TPR) repeat protein
MRNITILFICLFLILISGHSQPPSAVDSLKTILRHATAINRADLLNNLSWESKYDNTGEAFNYAMEALQLSEKLNYIKGKAEASKNLAALNLLTNNGKEAMRYANQGIIYSTAIRDTFTLAKLYNLKALVLEDQSLFTEAITLFNTSYQLFDKIGDRTETTGILNNLAVLYGKINENRLELSTYLKVITIEEKAGNKLGLARTYNNLAGVYNSMGDLKNAMKLYQKGLSLSRQVSSARFESAALNGIGLIQKDLKQYNSAIGYLESAANLNRKNGYVQWLGNNLVNLASIYLLDLSNGILGKKYITDAASIYISIQDWNNYMTSLNILSEYYLVKGDSKEVLAILKLSDRYEDSVSSDNIKRDYYLIKYKYYKSIGNKAGALDYFELATTLDDSIESRQQLQQSYELQAKYDLTKQQQENEKLRIQAGLKEKTIQNQRIAIGGIIIISLLSIVIVILAFRAKRKIKKANNALNEVSQQIQVKATALQMANESKDKFLSIISHDLKNPISAITGLSDLLLDNSLELTDEDKLKYIKYINEGCLSADQLLENLMKWVRSQTGKMEMKSIEFDLAQPVNDAIALVQNSAIRKQITISSAVQEGTRVFADHEMISTCLINLLSNAVKFTPLEGNICVTPEINGKTVSIMVSDTGVGISPEHIQKLFRLDTKSGTLGTANEKGTGLGLLLVKEFIEKNNGKINVQSTPGKGSTFTLTLPINGN